MARPAKAEINLKALLHNYRLAEELSNAGQCLPVVKANAYGHGAVAVATALADVAPALGVACIEEAIELRQAGIKLPILLLEGPFSADEIAEAASLNFWLMLSTSQQVDWVCQNATAAPLTVWLKVDTGMHRLGVTISQAAECYRRLEACNHVQGDMVLASHFASADDLNSSSPKLQLKRLQQLNQPLGAELSMANSPGLLGWPDSRLQWNRPGFMLYGNTPFSCSHPQADLLQPVMSLSSAVIALREVAIGEAVGYGETWRAERHSIIATVAIGYGDGYPRHAKNGTPVAINGQRATLVGRVSMDMITVDVTDIPSVKLGDEVLLWGESITANEIAQWADTSAYELLTRMSLRTPEYINTKVKFLLVKLYKNRSFRTIFLAIFATATFVGSAIWVFDVDPRLMLNFFLASLLGLGIIVMAALAFTGLRMLLRKLFGGS
ncbi:alanine racemase [Oceanicoccus sp. KOV_DT_Chl]|uniref:alanine racemase n=1 Tax=Oceanicoccus sp. KOV_DT_Chl TaxID=1904639 RepID=UPI000C7E1D82|nr:alanine racemase [Oceanicoccus sp. KOV_DT_Chl]